MRRPAALAVSLVLSLACFSAHAADVDGPDCDHPVQDFGDAPEGVTLPNLLHGHVAAFPTCLLPGPVGSIEAVCPPRGTPPGAAGFVRHLQPGGANYWIKALPDSQPPIGVDSESDGKFSLTPEGASVCDPTVFTDPWNGALYTPYSFGQDEYQLDRDGGIATAGIPLQPCHDNQVIVWTRNCGSDRTAYLNVLVDMNDDGDWNDNVPAWDPLYVYCTGPAPSEPCAHEWALKNVPVPIPAGQAQWLTPPFRVGTQEGWVWMRVTLSDGPVPDDFCWAGSANLPGGSLLGGETEDQLVAITAPLPARQGTWGGLKIRYR